MTVSKMKVRDGTQLAYEVRGRVKDAVPVVLIHSLAMDHTFWNAVTPALSEATAVLTYDCRGHGQSDKPDGTYRRVKPPGPSEPTIRSQVEFQNMAIEACETSPIGRQATALGAPVVV